MEQKMWTTEALTYPTDSSGLSLTPGLTYRNVNKTVLTSSQLTFIYVTISFSLFGILGNLTLTLGMLLSTSKTKTTNMLIINAAFVNLFCCICFGINEIIKLIEGNYDEWQRRMFCKFFGNSMLFAICKRGVTGGLLVITFERYMKIAHPILHRNRQKPWMVYFGMVFPWIYGFLSVFPYLYWTTDTVNGKCKGATLWPNYAMLFSYTIYSIMWNYVLPLTFFIYSYSKIAWIIRSKSSVAPHTKDTGASGPSKETGKISRAQKNVIKTMCLVVGSFAIFDAPIQYYVVQQYILLAGLSPTSWQVSMLIFSADIGLCIDPLLYLSEMGIAKSLCHRIIRLGGGGKTSRDASHHDHSTVTSDHGT